MEVMFHFIFELLKISLLACIYATLIFIIFKIIQYFKPDSWFGKVSRKKFRLWFISGLIVSVVLFIFMFTYFGDHGLGDSARVPIGHFKAVRLLNGENVYLQNNNGDQLDISNFTFDSNNLYAEIQKVFDGEVGDFVIWNLQTDEWAFYKTKEDYIKVAQINKYPLPNSFKDFGNFYSQYWNGWRFWMLP